MLSICETVKVAKKSDKFIFNSTFLNRENLEWNNSYTKLDEDIYLAVLNYHLCLSKERDIYIFKPKVIKVITEIDNLKNSSIDYNKSLSASFYGVVKDVTVKEKSNIINCTFYNYYDKVTNYLTLFTSSKIIPEEGTTIIVQEGYPSIKKYRDKYQLSINGFFNIVRENRPKSNNFNTDFIVNPIQF